MSFYGSVYYQLIDTFYKVVLRNKGVNNTGFLDKNKVPTWSESQAIGRKGVFGFDSGNRWINLNTYVENSQDSNDQYSIYEIYHAAPDPGATGIADGFKALLDTAQLKERTGKDGIIQLDYGDTFETYETKFDKAGHIASATKKTYRLPKDEEDERLEKLEKLVGTETNRTLPDLENEADKNLYGYVESNTQDLSTLKNYIGGWDSIYSGYFSKDDRDYPSIADIIGDYNKILGESYVQYGNFKDIVSLIGNMSDLWSQYDTELTSEKYSLVKTILDLKDRYDDYAQDNNSVVNGHTNSINIIQDTLGADKRGDRGSVYTEIIKLDERIDDVIADQDAENAKLDARLITAEGKLNTLETDTIPSIHSDINTINNTTIPAITKRIDAHEVNWGGTQAALEQVDLELRKADSDTNDRIDDILNLIGTVPADTTVMGNVDSVNTTLTEKFNDLNKRLGQTAGTLSAFEAIGVNTQDITNIKDKIGDVGDKSLQQQIVDVKDNYVKNTEMAGYLEPYAKTTTLDSYALKTDLDDYTLKTTLDSYALKTDLDDYALKTNLDDYALKTDLDDYALKTNLDDYATKEELVNYLTTDIAAKTYAAASDLQTLITNLGMPADFKEGDTSVLQNIFSQLSTLSTQITDIQADIVNIKTIINNLHSDEEQPPFSIDDSESEEELTPEEEPTT